MHWVQDRDHNCIRYSAGTKSTLCTVWGQVVHWVQDRDHKCIRYSTGTNSKLCTVWGQVEHWVRTGTISALGTVRGDKQYIRYNTGTSSALGAGQRP